MKRQHVLSARGDLAQLLDLGGMPIRGDSWTVCNTGLNPDYTGSMGAGYRMIADLSDPQGGFMGGRCRQRIGPSRQPALHTTRSVDWLTTRYHTCPLKPAERRPSKLN